MSAIANGKGSPLANIGMSLAKGALKSAGIDLDPEMVNGLITGLAGLAGKKTWGEVFCGLIDYSKNLPIVG